MSGRNLQSKSVQRFLLLRLFLIVYLAFPFQVLFSQELVLPDTVHFKGLKKTRESIALRELAFQPGQSMLLGDTSELFQKSLNNLLNTRLFHSCRYYIDSLRHGDSTSLSFRLVFELQERWYTIPIPVLELADRNFNEWWYDRGHDFRRVNAGLTVLQKNVRGRNEDLLIGLQTGFTRRFDFAYFIPYLDRRQIFGLKLQTILIGNREVAVRSFENRLDFRKDEQSFGRERVQAGIQLTARRNIYRYHSFDLNYHYNRISPFVLAQNPDYFLGSSFQRYAELRYTLTFDHRNYRFYATRGWHALVKASRFGLMPKDNFSLWAIQASVSAYRPLSKRFFWASRIDAELAESKRLPYLGSRTLGYENRFVRGYERNVLEGNASFHVRNSLRWKMFSHVWKPGDYVSPQFRHFPLDVFLCPFMDLGGIRNPWALQENKPLSNTMLLGYGLGLHLLTVYDLVIRAEYTMNRQGGRGLYFSILSDI